MSSIAHVLIHILKKILYTVRLSLALSPTVTVDSLYDDPMLSTWLLVRQSRIRLAGISRLAMAWSRIDFLYSKCRVCLQLLFRGSGWWLISPRTEVREGNRRSCQTFSRYDHPWIWSSSWLTSAIMSGPTSSFFVQSSLDNCTLVSQAPRNKEKLWQIRGSKCVRLRFQCLFSWYYNFNPNMYKIKYKTRCILY